MSSYPIGGPAAQGWPQPVQPPRASAQPIVRTTRDEVIGWLGLLPAVGTAVAGGRLMESMLRYMYNLTGMAWWLALVLALATVTFALLSLSRSASTVCGLVLIAVGLYGLLEPVALATKLPRAAPTTSRWIYNWAVFGGLLIAGLVLSVAALPRRQRPALGAIGVVATLIVSVLLVGLLDGLAQRRFGAREMTPETWTVLAALIAASLMLALAVWAATRRPWGLVIIGVLLCALEIAMLSWPDLHRVLDYQPLLGMGLVGLMGAAVLGVGLSSAWLGRRSRTPEAPNAAPPLLAQPLPYPPHGAQPPPPHGAQPPYGSQPSR